MKRINKSCFYCLKMGIDSQVYLDSFRDKSNYQFYKLKCYSCSREVTISNCAYQLKPFSCYLKNMRIVAKTP